MRRTRTTRAHAIALPRPAPAVASEWVVAAVALVLLAAGLLFS